MDDRGKEFNHMVEQIRNFIIHCLGFQPDDMTGGEFNNRFIWKTNNSELEVIAYYGDSLGKDDLDYYLTIDGQRTSGNYSFGTQLTCEDEDAIAKIIKPFKETVVTKTTLNVTTNIEQDTIF